MEALKSFSFPSLHLSKISNKPQRYPFQIPTLSLPPNQLPNSSLSSISKTKQKSKLLSTTSSTISTEPTDSSPSSSTEIQENKEKFDWFSHWYPIAAVYDLDKRVPHAKRVMGIDIVIWWDRIQEEWKVFDDSCPHRLAPLSEGRIDQWGRLQCVYHGWCFNGSGDCKFIPQAPLDGPPVHTFKKACAAVYPSFEQNSIVWFWPNTDPQYKNIAMKEKPPYIPELDDPSFSSLLMARDVPYGYEVLIENLMDPAHIPYAHYGLLRAPSTKSRVKSDREGGGPIEIDVQTLNINGFFAKREKGFNKFVPPCLFYYYPDSASTSINEEAPTNVRQKKLLMVFFCIPVSPGKSRVLFSFPRNFGVWIDRIFPRWVFHVTSNLVLDSDLYLLHLEERKLINAGPSNWLKTCYVPTKSDALVIAFRIWLRKYSGGQIDWGTKFSSSILSTPPKEQLMDRYWSHVVSCSSCRVAIKFLKVLEVALLFISFASIGIVAAMKHGLMSAAAKTSMVSMAFLCFVASRLLSDFIYKAFYFHDYNHALR